MSNPDTELIKSWQKDPLKFCDEALLLPIREFILTDDEKEAFRELAKLVNAKMKASFASVKSGKTKLTEEEMAYSKKRGISIMAGRGNGKSTFVALAIIWFFFCFPGAVIPCTATNAPQLENVIWRNISSLLAGDPAIPASKPPIKDYFVITKQKVVLKGSEREAQYVVARTVNTKGTSDEQTETLSGFHSDFMMFIVDEACHDEKTEVLTENGWKFFKELKDQVKVLTMHPDTHIASYKIPIRHYCYDHDGDMIKYKTKSADFVVTPNHELYYSGKPGKLSWKFNNAGDMDLREWYMKRDFIWEGKEVEYWTLPYIENFRGKDFESRILPMDKWLEFLGWYLSEGCCKEHYITIISQKDEKNKRDITKLIQELGFKPKAYKCNIEINNKQLATWLHNTSKIGNGAPNKTIPRFIGELSPRQIKIFLGSFLKGDGYVTKNGGDRYCTSSKRMADDLQELILKSGKCTSLLKDNSNIEGKKTWIVDHWAERKHDLLLITGYKRNAHIFTKRDALRRVHYEGKVYCVEVPPHNLIFTRRNGRCLWSGNSGVPNPVFNPIERTQTGKINFAILIFNPTRRTGYALDTHYNKIEKHRWIKLQWNAEKSPIVSRDHIDFMREKYGIDSDAYRVNVLGLPAKSGSGSLIPWEWVDNAIDKPLEIDENFPVIMGVDVARSGDDDTAICIRRHKKILPIITYHGLDSREVAQKVEAVRAMYEVNYVFLDIIGVGSGVWDLLKVNNWVYAFQASWGADNLHPYFRFYRLLDEIAWRVREQFQNGNISIPNDTVLKDELSSRQWDPGDDRKDGKAKIESKQLMKKRGLHSPNRADALMMCYRYPDEYYLNQAAEDEDDDYYSPAQNTSNIWTGY